jgi:hypothetical protein
MNLFWKDRWGLEPTASVKILYTTLEKPFLWQRDKRADRTPIFFLSLKIFFFSCNEPFLKIPTRPRTNGKRGNSIYYTWKTFFKANASKGPIEHRYLQHFLLPNLVVLPQLFFIKRNKRPFRSHFQGTTVYEPFRTPLFQFFHTQRDKRACPTSVILSNLFTLCVNVTSSCSYNLTRFFLRVCHNEWNFLFKYEVFLRVCLTTNRLLTFTTFFLFLELVSIWFPSFPFRRKILQFLFQES